jgi:Polysaccharide lyase
MDTGRVRGFSSIRRPSTRAALAAVAAVVLSVAMPAVPAAALTTSVLRPNADVVRQWTGTPGTAWAALDDPVTEPATVPATDHIYGSVAGRVTEVALTEMVIAGSTGSATVWFFANTGPGTQLRIDAVSDGTVLTTTTVPSGSGFTWRSLPPVAVSQVAVDDLRLRFTAVTGGDTNVRAAYVSLVAPSWQQTWAAPGNSLSEWQSRQQPAAPTPARLTIATPPTTTSGTALRVELRDGDVAVNSTGQPIAGGWRAEVVGPREFASSTPVRYEWSTLLAASYPDVTGSSGIWQVITQWHQGDSDVGGSPPIALIIIDDEIRLDLHAPDPANPDASVRIGQYTVANRTKGSWHAFSLEVRWALSNGYVKIWHNGQLAEEITNIPTLFPPRPDSTSPPSAYLKMGLYRKAVPLAATFVLYHDQVRRLTPQ